mmetsp:Transcript_16661/g.36278  ORF Transcript_16661/g.36278 Transcript_16661/m.36278 type:complete len:102 (+) Transcript_16661:208-513(+)
MQRVARPSMTNKQPILRPQRACCHQRKKRCMSGLQLQPQFANKQAKLTKSPLALPATGEFGKFPQGNVRENFRENSKNKSPKISPARGSFGRTISCPFSTS